MSQLKISACRICEFTYFFLNLLTWEYILSQWCWQNTSSIGKDLPQIIFELVVAKLKLKQKQKPFKSLKFCSWRKYLGKPSLTFSISSCSGNYLKFTRFSPCIWNKILFVSSDFFERYLFLSYSSPLVSKMKYRVFSSWRHFVLLDTNLELSDSGRIFLLRVIKCEFCSGFSEDYIDCKFPKLARNLNSENFSL